MIGIEEQSFEERKVKRQRLMPDWSSLLDVIVTEANSLLMIPWQVLVIFLSNNAMLNICRRHCFANGKQMCFALCCFYAMMCYVIYVMYCYTLLYIYYNI